jgi:ATP-dependent protease HslVU (ClpYQ) peptidase subunit
MTTIVYDPKTRVMAGDSQDTEGHLKMECQKIYEVNGHLIGTAGGSYSGLLFVRWFENWEEEPSYEEWDEHPDLTNLDLEEDFECLVVRPDGSAYTINRLFIPYELPDRACGVGSGSGIALGAMMAGANVRRAVAIACEIDAYSSGPIQWKKLKKA